MPRNNQATHRHARRTDADKKHRKLFQAIQDHNVREVTKLIAVVDVNRPAGKVHDRVHPVDTPLTYACRQRALARHRDLQLVQLFLDAHADVQYNGGMCLGFAMTKNDVELAILAPSRCRRELYD
mmetsp:Transcript_17984/g.53197  ORF Transcript_17984/g.53197 Transcript_17984/m.53197 type:complete len:125 (-) Transcript_17984:281-655(-)